MVAIEKLGFPCHHMEKVMLDDTSQIADWIALYEAKAKAASEQGIRLPARATVTDHESLARLDRVLGRYPARVDFPSSFFFQEQVALAEASGEEWFVLHTVRDSKSWVKSISETIYAGAQAKYGEDGKPSTLFVLQEACARVVLTLFGYPLSWLATLHHVLRMFELVWLPSFLPDNKIGDYSLNKKANADRMAQSFDEHTEWVKSVVPKDRLIVFHPRDGWEPLCTALKVPVPDEPFPKVNSTEEFRKRMKMAAVLVWMPVVLVAFLFLLLPLMYGLVGGAIRILALVGFCSLCQKYRLNKSKENQAQLKAQQKKEN
uniref:Uncharacterized protein n=1 Tax=Sexangularia sp. CB-2014 TaxID=1486929 RepID=A0A7S1VMV2_9EUKA|mmetsp:Transcript_6612/g.21407  ORF Transcript_6612/g.21407 Transcript_6612/m.21407 type:complete len:317 (+) Transcript_6612:3-953(+)